jgi:hypothetical protein
MIRCVRSVSNTRSAAANPARPQHDDANIGNLMVKTFPLKLPEVVEELRRLFEPILSEIP